MYKESGLHGGFKRRALILLGATGMVVLNTESSSYRNSGALYIGMDISISGQSSSSDVAVRREQVAREEENELIFTAEHLD